MPATESAPQTQDQIREWKSALSTHPLISELSHEDWGQVQNHLEFKSLSAGTQLISQGDASGGLYFLLYGRGRVLKGEGTDEEFLGEFLPGEFVGELSLLTGHRRSATVRMVRDSVVAFLSAESFEQIANTTPSLLRVLGRIAADRTLGEKLFANDVASMGYTLALLPVDEGLDLMEIARGFQVALSPYGAVGILTADDISKFGDDGVSVSSWLSSFEQTHEFVIYLGDTAQNDWARQCVRHADRSVFVYDATQGPQNRELEDFFLHLWPASVPVEYQILLVHPSIATPIQGTADFLRTRHANFHHHFRRGLTADLGRIARLLTRRGIGVSYSGAASRGGAHAGLLLAMQELEIPIDIVSGNSSGSGLAVLTAMQLEPAELIKRFTEATKAIKPKLAEYGPPFIALLSGASARKILIKMLGEVNLEDLPLPCVVTAVDISCSEYVEIRDGPAWLGARASGSLPGFYPPVTDGKRVLIDGGIMSNMPINCIEPFCVGGLLIASDLNLSGGEDFKTFQNIEPYGDSLSGWQILLDKVLPWRKERNLPTLSDIIMHTMCIASYQHQNSLNRRNDDHIIFLRPDLPAFGFFDVTPEVLGSLIEIVRENSLNQLSTLWAATAKKQQAVRLGATEAAVVPEVSHAG